MKDYSFLHTISDRQRIVTPIDTTDRFPEVLVRLLDKYGCAIDVFCELIARSSSSTEILREIRTQRRDADERMALLKMFRRCVAPVLDTETTKKIRKVSNDVLIENYGHTFKDISLLKTQFAELSKEHRYALAALIGEYDMRGQVGYALTKIFFEWFEGRFAGRFEIEGPRGAGPDIQLSDLFPAFDESYPCDFIVRRCVDQAILAAGFARYDSTRGGAQSDDRTEGNANKVHKARKFESVLPAQFKIIFPLRWSRAPTQRHLGRSLQA